MGNALQQQRGGSRSHREESPAGPIRWPSLSLTWEHFQNRRMVLTRDDPDGVLNGLELSGICLPESVLEHVLSLVDPQDILKCNLVCRNWKDIITRKSYWRKWWIRNKWDWTMVPEHVKEKPEGWIVLNAQLRNMICTRNFIQNHSGAGSGRVDRFDDWVIYENGGDRWRVESPPRGCDPLPSDLFFGNINSAFVTSYQDCYQYTVIDLWKMGLTPPVMSTCLPFDIICSQMYTVRFDCGGHFKWTLRILDSNEGIIMDYENSYYLPPQRQWEHTEHAFSVKEEHKDKMDEVRYVVFIIGGKDSQFWKGHYGPKFARSCVKFMFRDRTALPSSNVSNVDN